MKLARGKRIALICFGTFLAFMAVCTIVAKGIRASGLPRVSTVKPYKGSLTHFIEVDGMVKQGAEYGIYVDEGLRIVAVAVGNGDVFGEGQALFEVSPEELEYRIAEKRMAIVRLEAQYREAVAEGIQGSQSRQVQLARARDNYDNTVREADVRIERCRQALELSQAALDRYDQYMVDTAGGVNNEIYTQQYRNQEERARLSKEVLDCTNALEDAKRQKEADLLEESKKPEEERNYDAVIREADIRIERCRQALELSKEALARYDQYLANVDVGISNGNYAKQYQDQEERVELVEEVFACAYALEDAMRQKEADLLEAARMLEDVENQVRNTDGAVAEALSLDIEYQEKGLKRLQELLDAEGWVCAHEPGIVVDCRLKVGERTADGASILYAVDDGERVIWISFTEEQSKYISLGTRFEMRLGKPDGSEAKVAAVVDYMEQAADGGRRGRLSFDLEEANIGQMAQLTYRAQTDTYTTCIPVECLFSDAYGDFVYTVEERQGILGTEWRVRRIGVSVLDRNNSIAAVESVEITEGTRLVKSTDKALEDGDTVRVVD